MLYFFSYARADSTPFLKKFYDDLKEAVRSKAGAPDIVGIDFRDTEAIEPGKAWPKAIEKALQLCKVFVYLHTPTYFGRDGCGKEFQVIKRRLAAATSDSADFSRVSCIQPVYWDGSKQPKNVPPEISQIQLTHETYGKTYNQEGMLHLIRTAYSSEEYWNVINQMAKRIQQAADSTPLPELAQDLTWDEIPPLFPITPLLVFPHSPAPRLSRPLRSPRYARFVWVVGNWNEIVHFRSVDCYDPEGIAEEWRPFLPDCTDPARLIATDAAREAKLTYSCEFCPESSQEFQYLIDKASDEYTPIVVVIDLWSLNIDKYRAVVKIFDKGVLHNSIVIIPWNIKDKETYQAREDLSRSLSEVFPIQFYMPDTSIIFEGINDLNTFKSELAKLLTKYVADINRALPASRPLPQKTPFKLPPQLSPVSGTLSGTDK